MFQPEKCSSTAIRLHLQTQASLWRHEVELALEIRCLTLLLLVTYTQASVCIVSAVYQLNSLRRKPTGSSLLCVEKDEYAR